MSRVLKVFGAADDRKQLAATHAVLADYDAFTLFQVDDPAARSIARKHLVEDITDQYRLPIGEPAAALRSRSNGRSSRAMDLTHGAAASPGPGRHHFVVQFVGPIKKSWLTSVKKAGGEPRAPYQAFAYVVRMDAKGVAAVSELPFVRWVGHLPHRARVAGATRRRVEGGRTAAATAAAVPRTLLRPGVYTVQFFGPEDLSAGLSSVKKLGFRVLDRPPDKSLVIVESREPSGSRAAQLDRLSAVHGIKEIRERSIKRPSNDVAAGLMGSAIPMGPGFGLSGRGETICVCDTGLDTGDPATIHPDFSGRIRAIRSFPITPDFAPYVHNPGANDGPSDKDSGHGTHVAGSVLGDGTSSAGLPGLVGPIRGLSHKAKLVFQAIEQELDWKDHADEKEYGRFLLAGIPADITVLLRDAYARGARIHSNSWGGGDPGAYDAQCEQLDRFVWKRKDMCVLVAAGNDGTDKDGNGRINPSSVTAPGTAKNCITIGASENNRPAFNGETYGDWWPGDYPASPFKNAPMADNPAHIVPFSSRGPTTDGRCKPDVLAPGTFVLSTRSSRIALNNTAWAPFAASRRYFHMGGTSMATPLAAGAVGLLREHLRKKKVAGGPTAALLKALLVASAHRLPSAGPRQLVDNHQGYGLIDLGSVIKPSQGRSVITENVTPGLKTGGGWQRTITLSGSARLRVVLAYSDFPGAALVNNLNLMVTGPDGSWHVGNQAKAGAMTLDASNNVEMIEIPVARSGAWRIDVIGANVPEGPQDFALVIVGKVV